MGVIHPASKNLYKKCTGVKHPPGSYRHINFKSSISQILIKVALFQLYPSVHLKKLGAYMVSCKLCSSDVRAMCIQSVYLGVLHPAGGERVK